MRTHRIVGAAVAAVLLIAVAGCDRSAKELEKTKAEMAGVQAELTAAKAETAAAKESAAKTEAALAAMTTERDTLKEAAEKAKTETVSIAQERDELKAQVETLAKAKEAAASASGTATEKLMAQLKTETQKSQTFQDKIKQLEALITTLKGQLKATGLTMPKL